MMKIFRVATMLFCTLFITACHTMSPWDAAHDPDCKYCIASYPYYNIMPISDRPLFNAGGSINQDVLELLMNILDNPKLDPAYRDDKAYWSTGLSFDGIPYTAVTTADFSNFVMAEPTCISHSGAIVIKLFETIPDRYCVANGHISEFTSQWWQLVYRATDESSDVLTLWMTEPYRLSPFVGTRYDTAIGRYDERFVIAQDGLTWSAIEEGSINTIYSDSCIYKDLPPCNTYFFENNYSASIARSNLLRDFSKLLIHFDVQAYLVAPKDIPGQWQSSIFQTGTNSLMRFYTPGHFQTPLPRPGDTQRRYYQGSENILDGLGGAGLIWADYFHFSLMNGKDGLSVAPYNGRWMHTTPTPTYHDLIWLPSDFETRSMGHNKDLAMFQTFVVDPATPNSRLRWNYWGQRTDPRQDLTGGRSGLWQLNGFDRGFGLGTSYSQVEWSTRITWLRSTDALAIGNANTIYHTGNRYGFGINQPAGMRPALHLCINSLLELGAS